ncbi:MAG: ABC transporter substrate-binding protein [Deltaproteobacteria bacterium]|nr:ABC transporter substrate-binding protein [Deltaproteobacteria bacterium]
MPWRKTSLSVRPGRNVAISCMFVFFLHFAFGVPAYPADKSLTRIRIGYVAPTADNVLVPIAQRKDFLKKRGIEAELISLRGGVQATQALLGDSIQFAQMAGSVAARATLSGGDLVMIAGFINRINYLLVSTPEINSPKDLTGKKIASASIGGSVDTVLRLGLKGLGIDPASVIFLPAGPPQSRLAALSSKQMEATIVAPESLVAVRKAGLKVLKDLSEVAVYIQHTGLVVRRGLLKENRKLARDVLAAVVEAIDFYRTHEQETIEIMERFTGIRDREALKASYDFHKRLFPQPPYPSREGFQTVAELIGAKTPSGEKVSPEIFFDRTVLDEIKEK